MAQRASGVSAELESTCDVRIVGRSLVARNVVIRLFEPSMQFETQTLIIDGLVEHWGMSDPTLNQDLVDIGRSYAGDVFLVAVDENDRVIGTGALRFGDQGTGQVVRMSVAASSRRLGIGQRMRSASRSERIRIV